MDTSALLRRARLPSTDPRTENLARKMYEANNPGGMSWVQRGWTVRETWLDKARQKLAGIVEAPDRA